MGVRGSFTRIRKDFIEEYKSKFNTGNYEVINEFLESNIWIKGYENVSLDKSYTLLEKIIDKRFREKQIDESSFVKNILYGNGKWNGDGYLNYIDSDNLSKIVKLLRETNLENRRTFFDAFSLCYQNEYSIGKDLSEEIGEFLTDKEVDWNLDIVKYQENRRRRREANSSLLDGFYASRSGYEKFKIEEMYYFENFIVFNDFLRRIDEDTDKSWIHINYG